MPSRPHTPQPTGWSGGSPAEDPRRLRPGFAPPASGQLSYRQADACRRPAVANAVQRDGPPMLFDNLLRQGQSQPDADLLRRKVRLEHPRQVFGGDSVSGILEADVDPPSA